MGAKVFRYFSSDEESEALRKNSFLFCGFLAISHFSPNEFEWLISVNIYLFGYSEYAHFSLSPSLSVSAAHRNYTHFSSIDIEYFHE